MMKIDIECNELNMIEGATKFIKNHYIKIIYFEQFCDCYSKFNKGNPYYIYDLLRSLDYYIVNQLNCTFEKGKDIIAIKKDLEINV